MPTLFVNRKTSNSGGTTSEVVYGSKKWHGLEPPWLDNAPFLSCIPAGVYRLIRYRSPKYGNCLAFIGGSVCLDKRLIDGHLITRFACLVHGANYSRQLQGCLAIGLKASPDGDPQTGHPAVWSSKLALSELLRALPEDGVTAVVRWKL